MFTVRYVPETDSTNDDAHALLGEPGSAGLVIRTDFQRAGRGRRGRSWIAPPGSALMFTAILPQPVRVRALWAIPFWTALCVAEGIESASGLRLELQWPNDLLLGGRKCCGILCISRVSGASAWAGCGVGLNVLRPAGDASLDAIDPPPAFLSDNYPQLDREAVFTSILAALERRAAGVEHPRGVAHAWEARAGLPGASYRILLDQATEPFDATALRLSDDGGLVVRRGEAEQTVSLADARVLRPD
jgi:BirA family biotin operon repressor/biotin-[acetyl-CoA-carboxylase] ligase